MERLVLDKRGKAVLIDLEYLKGMKFIKNRWRYITEDGEEYYDPSNALEYMVLFSYVPFFKADPTTLLNMKKVSFVAARKAHTEFGVISVTRPNQIKMRKYLKNRQEIQKSAD